MVPVISWSNPHNFMEGFGEIQPIFKAYGCGDGRDGEGGMLQEVAGLLDAEGSQVFLGGFLEYGDKGAEQVAAANAHIGGDVLDGDRVGVVGGNIGNGGLHIAAGRIGIFGGAGMLEEERQGAVKPACHFHGVHKLVPVRFINAP